MIQFEAGEDSVREVEKNVKVSSVTTNMRVKVLGIGDAGCSTISRVYSQKWSHIRFLACDSSIRTLSKCTDVEKVMLGESITGGWGTGGDAGVAVRVGQEAEDKIKDMLQNTDLLFVVCSLAKGLGTGICPIVLKTAKEMGILSIGFFILPFNFEGQERINNSQRSLENLWPLVDGAVVVSNDALLHVEGTDSPGASLSVQEAFMQVDKIFEDLLFSIHSVLYTPGVIDLDFADIRSFLTAGKQVVVSTGRGNTGEDVEQTIDKVLYSPFWGKISFEEARSILLVIRADERFKLTQLQKIILSLREKASPRIPMNFGVYSDEEISDEVVLTLLISNYSSIQSETEEQGESLQETGEGVYDQKDLDVPTFLRKQHN